MSYIAHIRESDGEFQTVEEHLLEVQALAEAFGGKIGVKYIAGLAGVLHDFGKYTDEFKDYILEAVNNPDAPPRRGSVDHSTAGGKLLYRLFHEKNITEFKGKLAEIVGNAIISHHSYLKDFFNADLESDYLKRVCEKELIEFETSKENFFKHVMCEADFLSYVEQAAVELKEFLLKDPSKTSEQKYMFLTKFIFSALIDADRTNTRLFEENKPYEPQENHTLLFDTYYNRLMSKVKSFQQHENANTPINLLRSEMSQQCDHFAEKPSGIYTLSIPTGGGKTLASLRYALKHAKKYNKKHIIYVVPFTTIIEQNAEEVRKILQDEENILEHHSNVIEDADDNDENQDGFMSKIQKLKLAKDNWDSPIIFTTMVQFLNTFYEKGSRNIRRLHNLSESVIIFDEVQKVPIPCVSLFNDALNFLKAYGRSSIVLCTATQPALDFVEHKLAIDADAEMIDRLDHVIDAFKRVEIVDLATDRTFNNEKLTDFIVEKMDELQSMLIILNTKSVVKDLYEKLKEQVMGVPVYHLSTSMCAAHRNDILEKIRNQLKQGNKIICVSTQLIEAGVDVSFECVIRSLAGLDSIAQAAGRCNRHGEMGIRSVYVIDHEEENLNKLKEIQKGKQVAKRTFIDLKRDKYSHGGHILSKDAMDRYFQEFYSEFASDLNYFIPKLKKEMTKLLMEPRNENSYRQAYIHKHNKTKDVQLFILNGYGTAAEHFSVIKNLTTSVIVPYGEGIDIISDLNGNNSIEDLSRLLRKAQQYTVNLFSHEKQLLTENSGLVSLLDGKIIALKEGAYSDEYGVDLQNESGFGDAIF
ncbi:CRISPR-associated endonuclease/helicase Cas3 [Cytobacillus eiseniae]|uniref:CRISPR-associated endonuclease/helicase Cas3 n=1 Tax=Cytobacillus eiseniae TaxID=762947 RepID=A0ABS4RF41_9BACI|nr:CRISPR-associated helicase/endonuclease Cas3 [Cytobacillus eiseniae]MBP2240975.1 CRISPR-associated endonuclease/helicase Cas3 [Cytobacillus eiseniae]